jgi:hypothetical protein
MNKLLQIGWSKGKDPFAYFTPLLLTLLLMAGNGYAQETSSTTLVYGTDPALTYSTLPTVTSDKDDYAPGETAIITGTGWTLDKVVDIHLEEEPAHDHHHGYHDTQVDEKGNWRIEYPIEARHIGTKFTVIVDGKQTGYQGLTYFTDANVSFMATGIPTGNPTIKANYTIYESTTSTKIVKESFVTFTYPGGAKDDEKVAVKQNEKIVYSFENITVNGVIYTALGGSWISGNNGADVQIITATYISAAKTNQSITFSSIGNKTYGTGDFTPGATASSGLPVSYTSSNTNVATIVDGNIRIIGAGSTVITASQAGNSTYNPATYVTQTFIVNTRHITVKANNNNKVYGNSLSLGTTAFSVDASTSMVAGESISAVTLISTGSAADAIVGSYNIVPSAAVAGSNTNLSNYTVTYSNGTLSVTQAPASINVAGLEKTYNGSAQGATVTTSPAGLAVNVTYEGSATVPTAAGSYAVVAALNNSNYAASNGTGTLVIAPKAITVTADAGQSKVFGAADPAFTFSNNASLAASAFTGALGRVAGENVADGPYAYTLGNLSAGTNYSLSLGGSNTFAITAKPVVITADAGQSKVFGAADPAFTFSNNASLAASAFTGALGRVAGENVADGPYAYTLGNLSAGTNYSLSLGGSNTFAITAKPVVITADAGQSKVFGAADPAFTFSNNASLAASAFTGALGRVAGENVADGPYAYTLGNLSAGTNYSLSLGGSNTFAITAKPVVITADAGQSKVFGAADPAFTFSNNASLAASAFTGALGRVAGENVADGPYAYTLGNLSAGTNYSLSLSGSATFAITPKAITVTADAGQSKVFGAADPAFTFSNNASLAASAFTGALGRVAGENVADGPYAYTLGNLSAGTNYSLSLGGSNTFAITAKPVVITADAGQSKVFGAADPAFTFSNNASLAASAFTGALGRVAGENVADGPYAYTLGNLSAGTNYSLSLGGSNTFAITAKPVVITADAGQSKVFGAADPAFTFSNNASLAASAFTGALGRVAGENVADGPYAYTLGNLSAGTNYSLSLSGSATFAITPKAITVTADAGQSKVFGAADPAFTFSNNASLAASAFTGALGRVAGENVADGPYAYTLGNLSAGTNYSLSLGGSNTFAITAKPVVITADAGQSKVFGAADPAFTFSNNASLAASAFTGALGRVAGENVADGPYAYTLGNLSAGTNYSLSLGGSNTFAITAKPVVITADAGQSKVFGAADPAFTFSNNASLAASAFTGALGRVAGENVADGPYAYTLGNLSAGTNYSLSLGGSNTFAITAKPVVITADAGQSKVFGAADPAFTFSNNASLAASAFTGALGRVAGENVADGPYAYTLGNLSAGTNYSLSLSGSATFAITPKAITVTADAQKKIAGTPDPNFTYKVTVGNLVGTDDFSGNLTRDAGELKGTYAINQGTLALSSNYTLAYVGNSLTIYNAASVTLTGSGPVEINTNSTITATFVGDVIDPVWSFGTASEVSKTSTELKLTSSAFAVHTVTLTYRDGVGSVFTTEPAYAVFFDPNAGFVTGGGWIISPVGPYEFMKASGRANFGFVSKYEKGAKLPSGNTEFQFHAGNLNFKSTVYEWLNVPGTKAQYKGSGTINGSGDYGFMLTASDGDLNTPKTSDLFRIKIWNKSTNTIVYDNQSGASDNLESLTETSGTIIGGGSIVIHKPKTNTTKGTTGTASTSRVVEEQAVTGPDFASITAYPNPLKQQLFVELPEMEEQQVALTIYTLDGRVMTQKKVQTSGPAMRVELEENFDLWSAGIYLLKVEAKGQQKVIRLMK